MANLVITSSTKSVKVVFNDASAAVGMGEAYFPRVKISEVQAVNAGYVKVVLDDGANWLVSTDGFNNTLIIDTIDGVAPTSNIDLCDKIAGLIDY